MNKIIYSAPANLMLMGEHAVLTNKKCISVAINKRTTVELSPNNNNTINIFSNLGNFSFLLTELNNNNFHFDEKFNFIIQTLKFFKPKQGFTINISSEINSNFGLGSSASLTSCLVACFLHYKHKKLNLKDEKTLIKIFKCSHKIVLKTQHFMASGYDLATSIFGGVIEYQKSPLKIKKLSFQNLPISVIYSGYKTKTTDVLFIVKKNFQGLEKEYKKICNLIGLLSEKASIAIENNNLNDLAKLMNINQGLLGSLLVNDKTLSKIIYWAKENKAMAAKISGSGLGDCVIAIGKLPEYPTNNENIKSLNLEICHTGIKHHNEQGTNN
jgi:mevalonate kinase